MSYEVTIDSRDYVNTGTPESFTVTLPQSVNTKSVQLVEAIIPQAAYNVASGTNILYVIEVNGGTPTAAYTVTLTSGNYTVSGLAAEIASKLTAATLGANTYTCTYNSTTDAFTITISGNQFRLLNATSFSNSQFLYEMLGFAATDFSAATSFTTTMSPMLSGPNYLYLSINQFGSNNFSSNLNSSRGMFAKIPLQGNTYSITRYHEGQFKVESNDANGFSFSQLTVRLYQYNNRPLTLRSHWSFTLRFEGC